MLSPRTFAAIGIVALSMSIACAPPPPDPLTLESNRLTVENRTGTPWIGVEVWLNRQYRVTVPMISPGERYQTPLDALTEGFGHRFDYRHQQITDLRLKATLPNGKPIEIVKDFEVGGLAGLARALKGKK
ncbi:MAG TPA: hypothetical protein VEU08_10510 [Vicinamibacterales bacterium]|nr:hypothetical protein [Vicinamibacterales bacterium]